jgi:hypothetical protein
VLFLEHLYEDNWRTKLLSMDTRGGSGDGSLLCLWNCCVQTEQQKLIHMQKGIAGCARFVEIMLGEQTQQLSDSQNSNGSYNGDDAWPGRSVWGGGASLLGLQIEH